ncbi:MAG: FkbM family methyltransferase [Paracoccaceae bacterium]|jgi:FkbM family methyltransferase|nr:FkbM family methyltransferase [Paracoccaceae bacterium]MDP7186632.1 FkbM family methyltransferase [Paracoccaceae bacterium]
MEQAANCLGVKIPPSPFLNESRIERLNAGRYEGQEILGVLSTVSESDRVLELGAGIGVVGAVAAHNRKPQRVLSFEANPALIGTINTLYSINGLSDRISVVNEVLLSAPDRPDEISFHVQNSYLGSSLVAKAGRATREVKVKTRDFEEVRRRFSPTILVMDIEGGELELLRHANLDGIRAIVIEFHPDAYGVDGMRECKNILRDQGFDKNDKVSTRLVWTCTRSVSDYDKPPSPSGGWSERIETVENARVIPPVTSELVQEAGVLRADNSYCAIGALWRNKRPITTRPRNAAPATQKLDGTWIWGGVMWMHFGHFLVESTSRLWALDQVQDADGIVFIPKRPRVGDKLVSYQTDFVKLMGSDLPIRIVTEPTEVEKLVVPGQGFGLGQIVDGTQAYRAAVHANFAADVEAKGEKKLYISRSKIGFRKGALIGEERLEGYLSEQGYDIFHPEEHDLRSQISRYKAASHIIAAEGSAVHLFAMVARPDQKLAVIARRNSGATDQIERHVHSFSGTPPVPINALKRTWMPVGKTRKRMGLGEINMSSVRSQLIRAGFIDATARTWTSYSVAGVEKLLGDGFELFESY